MSEFAWKECNCGKRVHMNSKCECGGDPWGIDYKKRIELRALKELKQEYLDKIEILNKNISQVEKELE